MEEGYCHECGKKPTDRQIARLALAWKKADDAWGAAYTEYEGLGEYDGSKKAEADALWDAKEDAERALRAALDDYEQETP